MSSMLEALQGGGGAPPMGGGPGGPPTMPPMGGPPPPAGGGGDPEDLLRTAVDALTQFAALPPDVTDDIDTATIHKALSTIQGVLATSQKNMEAAQGTTGAHKAMAKQIQGIASEAYGG